MLMKRNESPDLILYNGTVHTVNEKDDICQAVAVAGNQIIAVGDDEDSATFGDALQAMLQILHIAMLIF